MFFFKTVWRKCEPNVVLQFNDKNSPYLKHSLELFVMQAILFINIQACTLHTLVKSSHKPFNHATNLSSGLKLEPVTEDY